MNTNRSFRLVGSMGLAVVCACLWAGVANAQDVLRGKFTLPFDAQWGTATLPAGDYEFTIRSVASPIVVVNQGTRHMAFVLTQGANKDESNKASELYVTRSGGRAAIRMLHSAELGTDFFYNRPKAYGRELAGAPELIERIPVLTNGK